MASVAARADTTATYSVAPLQLWQKKPAWLTDLSAGVRESYDDNVLLVSGNGLPEQDSWVTTVLAKVGFDFAPLLGTGGPVHTLTLAYAPEINIYHNAPQETYFANRVGNSAKVSEGDFSFSLDNGFLYNDGNRTAPIYAESQAPGGNTNDRFRNFFAQAAPRERRNQIQDRGTVALQYRFGDFFLRPTASTIYYGMNTVFHNASAAPYIGYQNWPDRYDANGGVDAGWQLTPSLAVLAGYRYGHQFQEQFPLAISADRHYSSSDYQRALLGMEGKPWSWLDLKLSAGPDFRYYNSMAPVNDRHDVFPYAEASATAAITKNQALTFYTKEWEWVASTGLVPYYDSIYTVSYHWQATRNWGFDAGCKVLCAQFSSGNDFAGTAPSLRNDVEYIAAIGVTYNFTSIWSANVNYNHAIGRNLDNLAAQYAPSYRNFDENLVSVAVQYKF